MVKRIFEIDAQEQKCQCSNLAKNSHFAILALLSLCIVFKKFFGQMTSGWLSWKTFYILLLKSCLRPCPGPSISLSKRINWVLIFSFPHKVSNIIFVLGSWVNFGRLGRRIAMGAYFWYFIFHNRRTQLLNATSIEGDIYDCKVLKYQPSVTSRVIFHHLIPSIIIKY